MSAAVQSIWSPTKLPKIAYGKGSYLYDTDGKQYIDGSGGPAVFCLGHGNEEVNQAIKDQLDRIAHGYRYTFTSDPLEQLTEMVRRACGAASGLTRMIFVSSGSEAVESCLKIALQYHSARGEQTRRRFIARQRSWHGNTLGALAVSGFRDRRLPFEGALVEASLLSPVNAYRPPAGVKPECLAEHCANELEQEIARLGAHRVAAFIFEPVVGAAGGAVPAPAGYAKRVREICDRTGVLMIADEVMCGSGRCGTWRALEHDGVVPGPHGRRQGAGGRLSALGRGDPAGAALGAHGPTPWRAAHRPYLLRPYHRLRRRGGGADHRRPRPAARQGQGGRALSDEPAAPDPGRAGLYRRHPRPRLLHRPRAGRRPREKGAL